jgi:hypothetical protein
MLIAGSNKAFCSLHVIDKNNNSDFDLVVDNANDMYRIPTAEQLDVKGLGTGGENHSDLQSDSGLKSPLPQVEFYLIHRSIEVEIVEEDREAVGRER